MLTEAAEHSREDISKVSDSKAQALFETTTEALKGLEKVVYDFELKSEKAWD
jgi:hypothetical protein